MLSTLKLKKKGRKTKSTEALALTYMNFAGRCFYLPKRYPVNTNALSSTAGTGVAQPHLMHSILH